MTKQNNKLSNISGFVFRIILLSAGLLLWTNMSQAGFIKRWFVSDVDSKQSSRPSTTPAITPPPTTTPPPPKKKPPATSSSSSSSTGRSTSGSTTEDPPEDPPPNVLISSDTYQQCKGTNLPSFINSSMSWANCSNPSGFQSIYDGLKSLSPPSIIVTSAGNSGGIGVKCPNNNNRCGIPSCPAGQSFRTNCTGQVRCSAGGQASCSNGQPLRLRCSGGGAITCSNRATPSVRCPVPITSVKAKASRDYNAIIVGNLDTNGSRHPASQQGPEVFIMAPSGDHLTTVGRNNHYRRFSGTSGATPLVTGSLAGFEWLSQYHPTPQEAKKLLEKTAIPTQYSNKSPRQNGVGMVNSYKLAMVGKRLKEQCGQDISCFKQAINNQATYSFPVDRGLLTEVDQAFPECSQTTCHNTVTNPPVCRNKADLFKKLRKEAFLHPSNKALWGKIACIYTQSGFWENGKASFSIYRALSGNHGKINQPKYCSQNSDCVLVPSYSKTSCGVSSGALVPINKTMAEYLYAQCKAVTGRSIACNSKCRCGRDETIISGNRGTRYQTQCVNNLCTLVSSRLTVNTLPPSHLPEDQPSPPENVAPSSSVK